MVLATTIMLHVSSLSHILDAADAVTAMNVFVRAAIRSRIHTLPAAVRGRATGRTVRRTALSLFAGSPFGYGRGHGQRRHLAAQPSWSEDADTERADRRREQDDEYGEGEHKPPAGFRLGALALLAHEIERCATNGRLEGSTERRGYRARVDCIGAYDRVARMQLA